MNDEQNKSAMEDESPTRNDAPYRTGAPEVESGNHGVSGCRLYRWYPPLLVVSTIMTGAFCMLYVTKPVFIEAPNSSFHEQLNVPIYAEQIADAEGVVAPDDGRAIIPVHLDPGLSSIPGEPVPVLEPEAGVPPIAELEPLAVPRARKPLFQPMDPDEMPAPVPPKAIALEPPPSEFGGALEPGPDQDPATSAVAAAEPFENAPEPIDEELKEKAVVMASAGEAEEVDDPADVNDGVGSIEVADVDEEAAEMPVFGPEEMPAGYLLVEETEGSAEDVAAEPVRATVRASLLGEFYDGTESKEAAERKQLSSAADLGY
jgi:hypothetical protein